MEQKARDIPASFPFREQLAQLPPEAPVVLPAGFCLHLLDQIHELRQRLIELQEEVTQLKRRLNTNSTNSSLPPSKDPPGFSRHPKGKSEGASSDNEGEASADSSDSSDKGKTGKKRRKGHPGACQEKRQPDEVHHILPGKCHCGCTEFDDLTPFYTHQRFEIPRIVFQVLHYILHMGKCRQCGKIVRASLPPDVRKGYGPKLSALIGVLGMVLNGSRRGIEIFLKDPGLVCSSHGESLPISQGSIQNILDDLSVAAQPHHEKIGDVAKASAIVFVDETSWPTFGQNGKSGGWLWIMVSGDAHYIKIFPHRNKEAFKELIGEWSGYLVSDDYALYTSHEASMRQSCLAHRIRRAKKLAEDPEPDIAKGGNLLLKELRRLTKMDKSTLTEGEWLAWNMRVKGFLKKHKDRDDALGTYCSCLYKSYESMTTFLRVEGVDATNNRAERALRPAVVKRKTCFGSTEEKGKRWMERALSIMQTARLNGWSFFDILVDAITRYLKGEPQDLSRYDVLLDKCLKERVALGLN